MVKGSEDSGTEDSGTEDSGKEGSGTQMDGSSESYDLYGGIGKPCRQTCAG